MEPDEKWESSALATVQAFHPNNKSENTSLYSSNLTDLCRRLMELHESDPNLAQVALMNLVFRSVGGGRESDLPDGREKAGDEDEEDDEMNDDDENKSKPAILEEMDASSWARIVTDLVDDMRHRPPNQILLCADPQGALHQSSTKPSKPSKKDEKHTQALSEYRSIYTQFWYHLSSIFLTSSKMTTQERLDVSSIREIIQRLVDLSPVGQPDVRSASCLAALSAVHAVLDHSMETKKKWMVAKRQYGAEARNKKGEKAESLKVRMESLGRTCGDLEEVVEMVVQGLFVHRYR